MISYKIAISALILITGRKFMIKQIDWSSWLKDDYIAIALVSLNLEVIYRKCGIEFKEKFDDFDYFKFALFEISLEDSGKLEYIMLKRYKNYPDEGTGVYMNKIIYSKNIFLEHFLEITKLSKYITWRAELA
ncbi:hypothetical protein [Leptospira alexanderi]|uniref:hypothetical protein n=1 Tax=Leptospira alexanderi TaxID=100053 RepID=UPI001FD0E01C|nr:hypothetical protein [Leptospira alexanderi]